MNVHISYTIFTQKNPCDVRQDRKFASAQEYVKNMQYSDMIFLH